MTRVEVTFPIDVDQLSKLIAAAAHAGFVSFEITNPAPPYPDKLIFINYRRSDSIDMSGRIHDHLVDHFLEDSVFRDYEDIPLGEDWELEIQRNVIAADVFLIIIGSDWLNETNKKRLFEPRDVLRKEIEFALAHSGSVTVIPVIVNDAKIPTKDELPPSLHKLRSHQAFFIRSDQRFYADMQLLIEGIEHIFELT